MSCDVAVRTSIAALQSRCTNHVNGACGMRYTVQPMCELHNVVAMVRCAVVDSHANDALVSTAADRITWTVSRGAGRLAGTASGNTSSHEWMKSHSVNAYLGLARGMFRVTQDCTSPARASCVRPFL